MPYMVTSVTLKIEITAPADRIVLAHLPCVTLSRDVYKRQASSAARIGDAHANYGLIPGAGGSVRLSRVVGPHMAKYLAFTGDHFPPSSPVLAGLVSEIVEPDELETRLAELAASLADKSPLGLRRMKHLRCV